MSSIGAPRNVLKETTSGPRREDIPIALLPGSAETAEDNDLPPGSSFPGDKLQINNAKKSHEANASPQSLLQSPPQLLQTVRRPTPITRHRNRSSPRVRPSSFAEGDGGGVWVFDPPQGKPSTASAQFLRRRPQMYGHPPGHAMAAAPSTAVWVQQETSHPKMSNPVRNVAGTPSSIF